MADNIASLDIATFHLPAYVYIVKDYSYTTSASKYEYETADYYSTTRYINCGTGFYPDPVTNKMQLINPTSVAFNDKNYKESAAAVTGKYIIVGATPSTVMLLETCTGSTNSMSWFSGPRFRMSTTVVGYGITATNKYETTIAIGNRGFKYYETLG